MQCDQIRQYLTPYVEGSLPGYKVAWVVQHLAGCPACAAAVAGQRSSHRPEGNPLPVAAAVEPRHAPADNHFEAVQRPVPAGLQVAAVVLMLAAAGGAVWLLVST